MKIKKKLIHPMWAFIEDNLSSKDQKLTQFLYALQRNKLLIQDEKLAIEATVQPSERFKEYEKKRLDIISRCVERDERGEIVWADKERGMPLIGKENQSVAEREILKLRDEYGDEIEAQTTKIAELDNILEEEVDIDFYRIPIDCFPKSMEGISTEIWWPWVKE